MKNRLVLNLCWIFCALAVLTFVFLSPPSPAAVIMLASAVVLNAFNELSLRP